MAPASGKAIKNTVHEIRALGAWLYDQEYIQAPLGHADEKMTKHDKTIDYVEVSAELVF